MHYDDYENLVHKLAWSLSVHPEHYEELVQVGSLALLEAMQRFDPAAGNMPTTYFQPCIRGAMLTSINHRNRKRFLAGKPHVVYCDTPEGVYSQDQTEVDCQEVLDLLTQDETPRDKQIIQELYNGRNMPEIGKMFGLTKQRIGQIVGRFRQKAMAQWDDVAG